jgi:hypothetical protein
VTVCRRWSRPDAITKGSAVKTKAAELLTMLGMPVPDALKG